MCGASSLCTKVVLCWKREACFSAVINVIDNTKPQEVRTYMGMSIFLVPIAISLEGCKSYDKCIESNKFCSGQRERGSGGR